MRLATPAVHNLLMLLAGASATLSFAPFNWPVFALVSVGAAYLLLRHTPGGVWPGLSFGTGFFGAGVSWVYVSIHYHGGMSVVAAGFLTLLFCLALGLLFAAQFYLYKRLFKKSNPAGFATLWLGFEWLRSWFLTGFPWLYLGYGWIDTPLAHFAPLGGIWLVSSAVVLIALLIATGIERRRPAYLMAAMLLFAGSAAVPTYPINQQGQAINVALVQPNIAQSLKWQQSYFEDHLKTLGQMSLEAKDANWIIWPETAIPRLINTSFEALSPWLSQLEQRHQILVSGFPRREWSEKGQNWIYLNSLGALTGVPSIYDKQRLVPFGEYIPLEHWLRGAINFFNLPMSSFSLPNRPTPGLQIGDQQVAGAICYEIAFPELVREGVSADAGLILTLSNDTWFEGSHAPAQHLQIARMRALENHRWLIRATNNGLTAVIDPLGNLSATLADRSSGILQSKVWPSHEQTLYQRLGSLPVLLSWLLILIGALVHARRQRSLKH